MVDGLCDDSPWYSRFDFIEALAALAALHSDEVCRKVTGANKPLYRILHAAASATRVEWYFNGIRLRHLIAASRVALLPTGTTSNEAMGTNNTIPLCSIYLYGVVIMCAEKSTCKHQYTAMYFSSIFDNTTEI